MKTSQDYDLIGKRGDTSESDPEEKEEEINRWIKTQKSRIVIRRAEKKKEAEEAAKLAKKKAYDEMMRRERELEGEEPAAANAKIKSGGGSVKKGNQKQPVDSPLNRVQVEQQPEEAMKRSRGQSQGQMSGASSKKELKTSIE